MDQPKACAICGETDRLVLDHDHGTGEIRGWLCGRCNVMLGYAADSQERLAAATEYLRQSGRQPRVVRGERTPAKRDRAEYMRKYRARKAAKEAAGEVEFGYDGPTDADRIAELEAEVRHLKAELAKRPENNLSVGPTLTNSSTKFNTRPFTPVPKTRK